MKPYEQNIAIAKVCGWKPTTDGGICFDRAGNPIITPPDYTHDLNAMQDALACTILHNEQWEIYLQHLAAIVHFERFGLTPPGSNHWWGRLCHMATAGQRAEALLKTLDLWGE
jgi:hypothetical protein